MQIKILTFYLLRFYKDPLFGCNLFSCRFITCVNFAGNDTIPWALKRKVSALRGPGQRLSSKIRNPNSATHRVLRSRWVSVPTLTTPTALNFHLWRNAVFARTWAILLAHF